MTELRYNYTSKPNASSISAGTTNIRSVRVRGEKKRGYLKADLYKSWLYEIWGSAPNTFRILAHFPAKNWHRFHVRISRLIRAIHVTEHKYNENENPDRASRLFAEIRRKVGYVMSSAKAKYTYIRSEPWFFATFQPTYYIFILNEVAPDHFHPKGCGTNQRQTFLINQFLSIFKPFNAGEPTTDDFRRSDINTAHFSSPQT